MDKTEKPTRIQGYDVARSLAVFGMIIVNFKIVMGAAASHPHWLLTLTGFLDGRAAATFVILAGVGLSLLSRRARIQNDPALISKARISILKRAAFLFIVGLLYSPIWPADILHFYGMYMIVGAFMITKPDSRLWHVSFAFIAGFVVLLLLLNYEAGWNWNTLEYRGFWTMRGMIRHLFFNGFHPVFPWTAFLIFGMWLGRQDVRQPKVKRQLLLFGAGTAIIVEFTSWLLIRIYAHGLQDSLLQSLLGTAPMPPMPQYLFAAGGTAVAVIAICLMVTEKFASSSWIQPFIATGQLSLSVYVAHVILGMGLLESFGLLNEQSPEFAICYAIAFFVFSLVFSHIWRKHFTRGPLEWLMRRMTG